MDIVNVLIWFAIGKALLIVCFVTEGKLSISRNIFRPDSFIVVFISFVAPHYWLVLSTLISSAIPFCFIGDTRSIVIDHKVAITLNDQRVVVAACTRCPHGLTVFSVHYKISIFLHYEFFWPSLVLIRTSNPNIVSPSINMLFYHEVSIALESQLILTARMVDTFITPLNYYFLVSVVIVLRQIRDEVTKITSKLIGLYLFLSIAFFEVDLVVGLVHRKSMIALVFCIFLHIVKRQFFCFPPVIKLHIALAC